jgi:hypothetical protein
LTRFFKAFACATLLGFVLIAGTAVRAQAAAAATPCWKTLLNDWYDGRIDGTYPIHCYRDALKHLPSDVKTYSSAADDIERALQSARAAARKEGKQIGPNTLVRPARGASRGFGLSGNDVTTAIAGRKSPGGVAGLADKLDPGSASSLPLPLLVLGGLAVLLVAAGGAGLAVQRYRARRTGS